MKRGRNPGLFQRLLTAGSRTTFHGRPRKGTVTRGKQTMYKGIRVFPAGDEEFGTELDSSRFESLREAKRFIDAWKKRGNPKGTKGEFERCVEAVSKRGGAYDPRAVCAVQERKKYGQKELTRRAVAGKRAKARKRNPEFYVVVPASGGSPVSRHYSREEAEAKRAALESKTGRSYHVSAADVDIRAKHGYRLGKRNPSGYRMYSGLTKAEAERRARKLKADDSKLRKLGGSGNYGSVEVHQTFEGPGHKEYGVFVTKQNPADSAIEAYKVFHGREPEELVTIAKQRHYHKHLAAAGELERLVIVTEDNRHKVTLSEFDGTLLCFNEQALKELARKGKVKLTQLFIEGGDQTVDLEDFGIDPDNVHEVETLGKAVAIDYFTRKDHLGSEGGEATYAHKFRTTNEGGKHKTVRIAKYPDVIYRVRDGQLEFSGGSYEITAEGIDK